MFARSEDMLRSYITAITMSSVESPIPSTIMQPSIPPTPSALAKPKRPLLRRPLPYPAPSLTPIDHSSHSKFALHSTDLKVYTTFSLTTLDTADDPLDLKSFYNTHFPLILKSIPCRTQKRKDGKRGGSKVFMYHPMLVREISTTMFQANPLSSPSAASLANQSSHPLSSTLRMIPSHVSSIESEDEVRKYPAGYEMM